MYLTFYTSFSAVFVGSLSDGDRIPGESEEKMRKGLLNRIAAAVSPHGNEEKKTPEAYELAQRDKRDAPRVNTYKDTTLYMPEGGRKRVIIRDMSETGLRIGYESAMSLPDYVEVTVMGARYLCHVVWRDTFEAGLEYCAFE